MTKISVGMVLSQLIKEANLSAIHVSERIGITRQNVYNDLKRTSMRDEQLSKYAKALGIDKKLIYDRMQGAEAHVENPNYLMDHLANLEEQFKRLLNQLDTKDRQIEGLQKTVDVLLGKSEDVIKLPTTPVRKMYADYEVLQG